MLVCTHTHTSHCACHYVWICSKYSNVCAIALCYKVIYNTVNAITHCCAEESFTLRAAALYYTAIYYAVTYCTVCAAALYYTAIHYAVTYCTVCAAALYYTAIYYAVTYCTVCAIILSYTVRHSSICAKTGFSPVAYRSASHFINSSITNYVTKL